MNSGVLKSGWWHINTSLRKKGNSTTENERPWCTLQRAQSTPESAVLGVQAQFKDLRTRVKTERLKESVPNFQWDHLKGSMREAPQYRVNPLECTPGSLLFHEGERKQFHADLQFYRVKKVMNPNNFKIHWWVYHRDRRSFSVGFRCCLMTFLAFGLVEGRNPIHLIHSKRKYVVLYQSER